MELWIRSQDKEQLRKIVDIKYQKGTLEDEDIEVIIGTTQYDEWEVLGQYKTKERALEVLDEIEEHIQKQGQSYILTDEKGLPAGLRNYGNIYEMPKEYRRNYK